MEPTRSGCRMCSPGSDGGKESLDSSRALDDPGLMSPRAPMGTRMGQWSQFALC